MKNITGTISLLSLSRANGSSGLLVTFSKFVSSAVPMESMALFSEDVVFVPRVEDSDVFNEEFVPLTIRTIGLSH